MADPAKIAFVGDSMADGLWGAFFRMTGTAKCGEDHIVLYRDARNGTGLARQDKFDWDAEIDTVLAEQAPDVVVASIGLNDAQNVISPEGDKVRWGSDKWLDAYTANVASFFERASAGGTKVLVLGIPNLRETADEQNATTFNAVYEATAKDAKGVEYVEPWRTTNEDGTYASYVADAEGKTIQVRAPDGKHFTTVGYDILARHLAPELYAALLEKDVSIEGSCLAQ